MKVICYVSLFQCIFLFFFLLFLYFHRTHHLTATINILSRTHALMNLRIYAPFTILIRARSKIYAHYVVEPRVRIFVNVRQTMEQLVERERGLFSQCVVVVVYISSSQLVTNCLYCTLFKRQIAIISNFFGTLLLL